MPCSASFSPFVATCLIVLAHMLFSQVEFADICESFIVLRTGYEAAVKRAIKAGQVHIAQAYCIAIQARLAIFYNAARSAFEAVALRTALRPGQLKSLLPT